MNIRKAFRSRILFSQIPEFVYRAKTFSLFAPRCLGNRTGSGKPWEGRRKNFCFPPEGISESFCVRFFFNAVWIPHLNSISFNSDTFSSNDEHFDGETQITLTRGERTTFLYWNSSSFRGIGGGNFWATPGVSNVFFDSIFYSTYASSDSELKSSTEFHCLRASRLERIQ